MTNIYPESNFEFPKQSLINRSPVFEIEKDICTILNADAVLSACGVNFYPEDSLQIEYEIKNAISKQGIVGLVSFDSLNYIGTNSGVDNCYDVNLKLQVTEQPTINRARASEGKTTKDVFLSCFYEGITGEGEAKKEYKKYIVPKRSNFDATSLSNTLSSFEGGIMQIVNSVNPEFPDYAFCSLQCHHWGDVFAGFEYKKESGNDYFEIDDISKAGVIMTEYEDFYIFEPDIDDEGALLYPEAYIDASVFKCYTFNVSSTIVPPTYAITALEACIQAMSLLADRESTKQFGTFCPVSMNQNSDAAFLTTVGLFKASYAMPKINLNS